MITASVIAHGAASCSSQLSAFASRGELGAAAREKSARKARLAVFRRPSLSASDLR